MSKRMKLISETEYNRLKKLESEKGLPVSTDHKLFVESREIFLMI